MNKFALIEREWVKNSLILNRMKKYKDVSIFLFEFGPFLTRMFELKSPIRWRCNWLGIFMINQYRIV